MRAWLFCLRWREVSKGQRASYTDLGVSVSVSFIAQEYT